MWVSIDLSPEARCLKSPKRLGTGQGAELPHFTIVVVWLARPPLPPERGGGVTSSQHSCAWGGLIWFCRPQSKLLTQYVLNLAKYDQNYDIRDRARFIRQLIVPNEKSGALSKYAKKLFLAQKPAPILESSFKGMGKGLEVAGSRSSTGKARSVCACLITLGKKTR